MNKKEIVRAYQVKLLEMGYNPEVVLSENVETLIEQTASMIVHKGLSPEKIRALKTSPEGKSARKDLAAGYKMLKKDVIAPTKRAGGGHEELMKRSISIADDKKKGETVQKMVPAIMSYTKKAGKSLADTNKDTEASNVRGMKYMTTPYKK